jgi:hypothetical protein
MQLWLNAHVLKEISEMAADVALPRGSSLRFPAVNGWPTCPGGKNMLAHTNACLLQASGVTDGFVVQRIVLRRKNQCRCNT